MESIKAMSWIRNLTNTYANLDEENQKEPTLDEAATSKSLVFQPRSAGRSSADRLHVVAMKTAEELVRAVENIATPDSDSVKYEFPKKHDYKKDEAKVVKELTKIASALSKLTKQASKLKG